LAAAAPHCCCDVVQQHFSAPQRFSMTTNDLTNLRWQLIRSVEANQILQDEIISLKSIVKSKEAQESLTKSEQIKQQNQMRFFVQNMNQKFNSIKTELTMTKKLYVTDMSLTNSDLVKLRSCP
jgi:regulator of replication initiation timing